MVDVIKNKRLFKIKLKSFKKIQPDIKYAW